MSQRLDCVAKFIGHCVKYVSDVLARQYDYVNVYEGLILEHPVYATQKSLKEKRKTEKAKGLKMFSIKYFHDLGSQAISRAVHHGWTSGRCYEIELVYDRIVDEHEKAFHFLFGDLKTAFETGHIAPEQAQVGFDCNNGKRLYKM